MASPADYAKHVQDSHEFELPFHTAIEIPQPFAHKNAQGHYEGFVITKFMVIEVAVAVVMIALFTILARRTAGGRPPRGRLWHMLDAMLLFIRDKVAQPAIGHGSEKFLPFLWTVFFFILFCNLAGLIPWMGSPTAALALTSVLAVSALVMSIGSGIKHNGAVRFWTGLVPKMGLPLPLAIFLVPMIFVIEFMSLFIKHGILAIRLLANMFAGHLVLAVILSFIVEMAGNLLWYGVAPTSILGATALSLLEILVAFIQAYVFTFLSALFIGMSVHQH